MSVTPKVINTPSVAAVAADGIQLIAKARVTVRANIAQLVGGAGEETILARQNQIFNARLTEATNRLLEPTVDFVNKRNAINQNTRNFLRASRGLNVLSGDAPTATNPNI